MGISYTGVTKDRLIKIYVYNQSTCCTLTQQWQFLTLTGLHDIKSNKRGLFP